MTYGNSKELSSSNYANQLSWRPDGAIEWSELSNAPKPATTKVRLQLQGKSLIRRFSCDGVFPSGQKYHLNAQTSPVYQYSLNQDGKLIGGLLTFFCRATDPESLLLLEVRKNATGELTLSLIHI